MAQFLVDFVFFFFKCYVRVVLAMLALCAKSLQWSLYFPRLHSPFLKKRTKNKAKLQNKSPQNKHVYIDFL